MPCRKKEDMETTSRTRITSLETIIKNLNAKLSSKNAEHEVNLKKLEAKKVKMKTKSIQTLEINEKMSSNATCDASTSPLFTKIEIDPNLDHDVSCLCRCHGDLLSKDKDLKEIKHPKLYHFYH